MHVRTHLTLAVLLAPWLSVDAVAQAAGFAAQAVVTSAGDRPSAVHAADLDGDGNIDVLSTSTTDDKVGWCRNLGGGSFAAQQVLATMNDPRSLATADVDGDGDLDVLVADEDAVSWQENQGGGSFGAPQVISAAISSGWAVAAADLDGDGDADVLTASLSDDKVAWYQNLGGGSFGPQQVLTTAGSGPVDVHAADLDGDGDLDVLAASFVDNELWWHRNLGGGVFGARQLIPAVAVSFSAVHTVDVDGDGDRDVLTASRGDHKTAWHENLGGGVFGPQQIVTTRVVAPRALDTADLDGDGDEDVVAIGSAAFDQLGWIENLGGGAFAPAQLIIVGNSQEQLSGTHVEVADLDGDGLADVLGASVHDDKIAWYRNWSTVSTYGAGCGSAELTFTPLSEAVVGAPMVGRVIHSPSVFCVIALGLSRTSLPGGGLLPFDLGVIGMTGCSLHHSAEVFGLATQPGVNPFIEMNWTSAPLPIGSQGLHLYAQAFAVAPGANQLGLLSSNATDWLIRL